MIIEVFSEWREIFLSVKTMECYHKHGGLNWFSLLKAHTNSELKYNQKRLRVKNNNNNNKNKQGNPQGSKTIRQTAVGGR